MGRYEVTFAEYDCFTDADSRRTRPNDRGWGRGSRLDMHGNVREWVADCWHDNYEGAPIDGRAWTTNCDGWSQKAVVRGGSWLNAPQGLRCAFRGWHSPSYRYSALGFRIVQDLNP